LRLDRLDTTRLAWAFALSVALHLCCWGVYTLGNRYHVWENLRLPAWVRALTPSFKKTARQEDKPLNREAQPPLMFVNVNPSAATSEAPKDAKYYSDKNSLAANPEVDKDTDTPRITGKQEQVTKTEDVERQKISKLQPALPADESHLEERPRSRPPLALGDLTLAKPELNPRTDTGQADQQRPRTLAQALARQQPNRTPGQKMKQAGGVKRHLDMASLDTKATPFGAYDAMFVEAVSQRWFDLLDSRDYASDGRGRVVLRFRLNYDGRITDMEVAENSVSETLALICQKAVLDPAPYEKWPTEMRLMVGEDFRKIQFTFYYN